MNAIPLEEMHSMQKEWVSGYEEKGIDMTSIREESTFWWDREVLKMFALHTPSAFRREDIWGVHWCGLLQMVNGNDASAACEDPRGVFEKVVHRWLRKTQPIHKKTWVKLIDKALTAVGW